MRTMKGRKLVETSVNRTAAGPGQASTEVALAGGVVPARSSPDMLPGRLRGRINRCPHPVDLHRQGPASATSRRRPLRPPVHRSKGLPDRPGGTAGSRHRRRGASSDLRAAAGFRTVKNTRARAGAAGRQSVCRPHCSRRPVFTLVPRSPHVRVLVLDDYRQLGLGITGSLSRRRSRDQVRRTKENPDQVCGGGPGRQRACRGEHNFSAPHIQHLGSAPAAPRKERNALLSSAVGTTRWEGAGGADSP